MQLSLQPVHEELLVRFPGLTLLKYSFYVIDERANDNDKYFFKLLFDSKVYSQQKWAHASNGEHGPYAISKIYPELYEAVSFQTFSENLKSRLLPSRDINQQEFWPNNKTANSRFRSLVDEIKAEDNKYYKLMISLDNEEYWSDTHRELRILEYFEEWITLNRKTGVVNIVQLIQD